MQRGLIGRTLFTGVVFAACLLGYWALGGAGVSLLREVWPPEEVVTSCFPLPAPVHSSPWELRLLLAVSRIFSGVEPTKAGLIKSVLPALPRAEALSLVATSPSTVPHAAPVRELGPAVGIYNTHTGETYVLTDGTERVKGRGKVVDVAEILAEELRRRGIRVLQSKKVHDTRYAISYLEAEKTVREMIYAAPEINALFDVHRDSHQPQGATTVAIQGKRVARVLIVVGSDRWQPFPTWRENLAFARRIETHAEHLYPGLCAGVRVKEGRYNQFLHPHALLLEIGGGVNNTFPEAVAAAELFLRGSG